MARSNRKPQTPEVCPVCGEDVPRDALACRECGADHNSGWREGAETYDGLDLGDESFDYDEFVRDEFGSSPLKPAGLKTVWWVAGVVLIVAFIALYLVS